MVLYHAVYFLNVATQRHVLAHCHPHVRTHRVWHAWFISGNCCLPKCSASGLYQNYLLVFSWHDKWVPVIMAWRVPGLRMEERPSIWRVYANIVNKHSRTADNGWYFSLGLGEVLTIKTGLVTKHEHAPRAWSDTFVRLNNGKGTWDLARGMLGVCIGQGYLQIFRKWGGIRGHGLDWSGLGQGQVAGTCT